MGFRRKLLRCDSALVEFTVVSCWRRGKLNEPMRRAPPARRLIYFNKPASRMMRRECLNSVMIALTDIREIVTSS